MVLTVHHLGHSQSDRIVWLCEELGLDYKLKKYDRSPLLSPPNYIALHPLGAAPVIWDDDVVLAESGACMDWILTQHGASSSLAVAPDQPGYADYLYWLHFANGTLQPAVSRIMTLVFAGIDEENNTMYRYWNKLYQILDMVDARLAQVPYLAGEQFTAADIMAAWSFMGMREFCQYNLGKYENIVKWLGRLAKREAFLRAREKGDPDIEVQSLIGAAPPPQFKAIAEMAAKKK